MVNTLVGKTLVVIVMITFLFSTSCTSYRAIKSHPDTVQKELKKGDRVKITTKDGENFEFEIVEISPGATEGFIEGYILNFPGGSGKNRDQRQILFQIFFNEIAKIEKKKFSVGKAIRNSVAVYGVALVVALIGLVILVVWCSDPDSAFPDCDEIF